jgi:hypothetical protein
MAKRGKSPKPKTPKPKPAKAKSPKATYSARHSSDIIRWKNGDTTKADPFFVLVINNIALERPFGSNRFVADMSTGSKSNRTLFAKTAEYIKKSLFGEMPGQAEKLLADSPHCAKIKLWSIYVWGLPTNDTSSLVGEHRITGADVLQPRRNAVVSMLAYLGLNPDIVFVVTDSQLLRRASAIPTTDDDTRAGIAATYDGSTFFHRFHSKFPGMVAIHTSADTMTAAHEFGHAFSSFTNGHLADLYVDADQYVGAQFNRKVGRPIPNYFATYQGRTYASDKTRNGLGYEPGWTSFHSELADAAQPAIMDNYNNTTMPMSCLHDKMTKAFVMDRIAAKVSR